MIAFQQAKFKDVNAPYFGEGVVIRVVERCVKHYVKRQTLGNMIDKMELSTADKIAFIVGAGLMSVCTDPKTGDFIFADDQLKDFVERIPQDLYVELSAANYDLNQSEYAHVEDLETQKKSPKRRNKSTN